MSCIPIIHDGYSGAGRYKKCIFPLFPAYFYVYSSVKSWFSGFSCIFTIASHNLAFKIAGFYDISRIVYLYSMITLSPAVAAALTSGQPVVALESTLISHGLPFPKNLELALQIEEEIRLGGCVPATIAVIKGHIHIGLTSDQIEYLATGKDIHKLNASDVALCVTTGQSGATTVAGTMFCAHMAGIKFFATGGMGGVHRGAAQTFDISQDLTAFKTYPVAVITAGAKSLLDLPKTLEVLETYGVPVVGYQTSEFPSFWSRSSGLSLMWSADTQEAMARMAKAHWGSLHTSGMVIANPIPAEFEIPASQIEAALQTALADADTAGLTGKRVTPYLLQRLRDILPATAPSNIELILHNARTGAAIALAYSKL
jgi:pseudouridine-5'-phosphate glycosidase